MARRKKANWLRGAMQTLIIITAPLWVLPAFALLLFIDRETRDIATGKITFNQVK